MTTNNVLCNTVFSGGDDVSGLMGESGSAAGVLSEGVRSHDLQQLRTNIGKCLTDTLFKKLLDLEEVREISD